MCLCLPHIKCKVERWKRTLRGEPNTKMSDTFSCVWSALFFACLIFLGHSIPIAEESLWNRHDENQEKDVSTTETDVPSRSNHLSENNPEDTHLSTLSNDVANVTAKAEKIASTTVPLTGDGMPEMEENKKADKKRDADGDGDGDSDSDYDDDDDDDDNDDDDDDDNDGREERGGALLRSYTEVDSREKRAVSTGQSEEEKDSQTERGFVDHVLDYSLDRKKREGDAEMETTTATEAEESGIAERKRRQYGDSLPYIVPGRSRREGGSDSERQEKGSSEGRKETEKGEEEEKVEEKEEEEEKKEELDEKLAMES